MLVFVPSQAFKRTSLILQVLLWDVRSRSSMEFIKLGVYSGSPLRAWWQWRSLSCVGGSTPVLCCINVRVLLTAHRTVGYIFPMYLARIFNLGGYFLFFLNFVQEKCLTK